MVWDIQSPSLSLDDRNHGHLWLMRLGEVTTTPLSLSLRMSHHTPTIIPLTVLHSKTRPFGKGAMVFLGKTDDEQCPVLALLMYLPKLDLVPCSYEKTGSLYLLTTLYIISRRPWGGVGLILVGNQATFSVLGQQPKQEYLTI